MEIRFILDWASFLLGMVSTLMVGFFVVFGVAYRQYKKTSGAARRR